MIYMLQENKRRNQKKYERCFRQTQILLSLLKKQEKSYID